jgi:hypothetical protein
MLKQVVYIVTTGLQRVKTDLRWDDVDWIDMAQDRDQWTALVNTALNLRFP